MVRLVKCLSYHTCQKLLLFYNQLCIKLHHMCFIPVNSSSLSIICSFYYFYCSLKRCNNVSLHQKKDAASGKISYPVSVLVLGLLFISFNLINRLSGQIPGETHLHLVLYNGLIRKRTVLTDPSLSTPTIFGGELIVCYDCSFKPHESNLNPNWLNSNDLISIKIKLKLTWIHTKLQKNSIRLPPVGSWKFVHMRHCVLLALFMKIKIVLPQKKIYKYLIMHASFFWLNDSPIWIYQYKWKLLKKLYIEVCTF